MMIRPLVPLVQYVMRLVAERTLACPESLV